jgi:hypothetical protein
VRFAERIESVKICVHLWPNQAIEIGSPRQAFDAKLGVA